MTPGRSFVSIEFDRRAQFRDEPILAWVLRDVQTVLHHPARVDEFVHSAVEDERSFRERLHKARFC